MSCPPLSVAPQIARFLELIRRNMNTHPNGQAWLARHRKFTYNCPRGMRTTREETEALKWRLLM